MVNFTIFAGGYTSFVASYLFNSEASSLTLLNQSQTGPSPSWITLQGTNSSILYAVNEVSSGVLQSFTINSNGSLAGPVDQVSSGGDGPAYASALSTGQVAILNYGSGNGKIIPTISDPLHFVKNSSLITFAPPDGGVSHPHMALEHAAEVFVSDLGADKIWRLIEAGSPGTWKIQGFIAQPLGSGPRHMAIFDNELYVLHELDNTLTLQAIPPPTVNTSTFLANVTIISPSPPAGATFAAAEILIPAPTADFPVPYIYVSNRNTGTQDPRGDTIAIFERLSTPNSDGSLLTLIAQVYTGLDQIRGMEFGPAENGGEAYLVASGFAGTGGVVVYERTAGGRALKEVARNKDVLTRTSFVWV
ncbi:hypothetical protein PILCRDRAFT_826047 [Piloderma croceum F 1598]|uniref:Isomerase YbhE n=1 Tax=Piloderma croceum (strain F 1598) TaxID=765440 RepID=A0A0C3ASC7_PILCF|nr:hypothetical protein PILCRDRAFT_826047 [Piloderma croceum F 1598]